MTTSHRPLRTAAALLALSFSVASCSAGEAAVQPEQSGAVPAAQAGGILDAEALHDIDVQFGQEAYDAMIETFAATGEKEWIEATVVLDGVTYERVGLRLKGNSSLHGLSGAGAGPAGGTASADVPEALPWLIRLDTFVEGQSHEGLTELVVRSNLTQTSVNEAVALDLLEVAGLATQDAALARFSVNGSGEALRLVVQHLDETWEAAQFGSEGLLYKAEAGGDYSYRGDDPAAYEDVFDQESGEADLAPLTGFLQFLEEADDATFAAELGDHLDVEAFARYLAVMELIGNEDDIDGPGNNSYLRYDTATGRFTVVTWDLNLAFGALGDGGFGGGPAGAAGERPAGMEPPAGREGPAGGRGMPKGGNVLSERFLADEEFAALYEDTLDELRQTLSASGAAQELVESWAALLTAEAGDLVDESVVQEEADVVAGFFDA